MQSVFGWWWLGNVMGAKNHLSTNATEIDGPFFGLKVFRSRVFETNYSVHVDERIRKPADLMFCGPDVVWVVAIAGGLLTSLVVPMRGRVARAMSLCRWVRRRGVALRPSAPRPWVWTSGTCRTIAWPSRCLRHTVSGSSLRCACRSRTRSMVVPSSRSTM